MARVFSVLILLIAVSTLASTIEKSMTSMNKPQISDDLKRKIDVLRDEGKSYTKAENYRGAIEYYSAILQLIEGISGEDAFQWRRRCGLTLAFCEMQCGHFYEAVARCSEVIDESTNYLDTTCSSSSSVDSLLYEGLQKAHHRRAEALKSLKKATLAKLDHSKVAEYKELCLQKTSSSASSSNKRSKATKEKSRKSRGKPTDFLQTEELLHDFTEECQINYPRPVISARKLKSLTAPKVSLSPSLGPFGSSQQLGDTSSNPFGGGFGGGLGGLGGALGGGMGEGGGLGGTVRLAGSFLGWSPMTTNRIVKGLEIMTSIYQSMQKMQTFISEHKEVMMIAAMMGFYFLFCWMK